jgi:ribosome recycling factor
MSIETTFQELDASLTKIVNHLKGEFSQLQIGRASSALVEHIEVEVYGSRQPLKAVANISVPDAKTVQIQPWDRSTLQSIEKAIQVSGLGINPSNDGVVIRLSIPPMTQERRKDLTKLVSKIAEESKISVRNARHAAMEELRAGEKSGDLTEDQLKVSEKKLQEKVDQVNRDIESLTKSKETDILTI